ncbi:MAG: Na/Pi cotransporter family protein [Bacteroidia bacterium]|nr:Na/Pi cotransporter family protein [Bacteroidia bacterium]NND24441.1 Na/Pi cotransporter family protein [Flavobacteriaceae bacterium]MBT8279087.1 Na/Pi cotransporter family protein [Bacteroidia bacterium]NNK60439.1 Na/Pi cotransporter family protein [Flavobacteriaceae bacterium]NNL32322.1 Na/Pi cotransporter family protein [Flavobacteriaceae bacterium]
MQYGFFDILQLIGSLGLFLFGMKVMSDALLKLAGNRMRAFLASMTSNRFLGIFTGFLITSVIQSSSATTLMVVSFSNAGLLTLVESISVIMGANIGTTITAWLITLLGFKVSMSTIALPLVGFGFAFTFAKRKNADNWGNFIIGFAILFIGLQFLKDAMPDLNNNPEMLSFLAQYTDLGFVSILLFLLIGTLLTIIIQSSSATMALTLIMTAQGWIPFELAAAMVLGENVGTTITANLAAVVGNYQAKRTARAHLIFNLIGVLWMLILFYPFLKFVSWLCQYLGSDSPYVNAMAIPVAISLFHTTFNIINTFFLVWFINPIAKLVERIVPEKLMPEKEIDEPKFITKDAMKYPETAIAAFLKESKYLFKKSVFEIVTHALHVHREDVKSNLKAKKVIKKSNIPFDTDVRELYATKVKSIYGQIIRHATKAQSTLDLNMKQNNQISEIKIANRKMVEIIKDVSELSRNVTMYLNSENKYIKREYNKFRKKVISVLRIIHLFRTEKDNQKYYNSLLRLKEKAKANIRQSNLDIDQLIRNDLITVDMASSLVNDNDNVNDMVKKLIEVAELLYGKKDSLLESEIASEPLKNEKSA